ncbi:hypothetical protein K440DRAFT_618897 [Wilcoxina mikolae CBS 423.85]|nr:hypothetical protein K440DRAFT_618897 [Wilcoxina mikolae CBS 423.85]
MTFCGWALDGRKRLAALLAAWPFFSFRFEKGVSSCCSSRTPLPPLPRPPPSHSAKYQSSDAPFALSSPISNPVPHKKATGTKIVQSANI